MSKIVKDDPGGVWVNIYKSLTPKNRDVYWTGSVGYSTKENAMTNIADKLHYIATIDIKQAVEKTKKERMTCKRYCPVWNDIDQDCEIYGEHHFTPRTCPHYQKEIQNEKSTDIR